VSEQRRGAVRKTPPARNGSGRPAGPSGTSSVGRIVTLFIGQSHGFIRLADGRDVFFHRSDVREGASFNEFAVGDAVGFELLEDRVSGPRGVEVERRHPHR
jgi:cold shock CspA family protein